VIWDEGCSDFLKICKMIIFFQLWASAHVWIGQVTLLRKVNMRKVISKPRVYESYEKNVLK